MKKVVSFVLALTVFLSLFMVNGLSVQAATAYNSDAAVTYAKAHWNDGVGACATFVSKCLKAGGVTIPNTSYYKSSTKSYENNSGTLGAYTNPYSCSAAQLLYLSERYKVIKNPKNADFALGDVVFMYGGTNMKWKDGHVGIIISISGGTPVYAAHNNATHTGKFSSSYPATYLVKMNEVGAVINPPPAVTGLSAVKKASTTATISWNASSGATSYEVQYQTPISGGWKADPDYKTKTATSYVSTDLINNYTYQYRVRAVNSAGASAWVEVNYKKS